MEKHKEFPSFWLAVLMLSLLFGLQIIISIVAYDLGYVFEAGDPQATALITVLSCGVVFSLLMHYKKLGYRQLFNSSSNSAVSIILALIIPLLFTVGGGVFWISDITNLLVLYFPIDESEYLMSARLMDSGFASLLVVCLIAPVVEEMLFRGLILRSFLVNYSVNRAIVLSSLLFALFHMNLYQLPVAFIAGCLFAWLYVRTRSLWASILAHALYNACAMLLWTTYDVSDYLDNQALTDVQFNAWWVTLLAILSTVIGLRMLRYILKPATAAGN